MIQRFEFCTELFWKYIKKYIEQIGEVVEYNSPVPVLRTACTVGVLNEQETQFALAMVQDRNRISLVYKEEAAEELLGKIPSYAGLMNAVARQLLPK